MFETHRDDGRQSFDASGAQRDVRDDLLGEASLHKDPVGVVPELKESMGLAAVASQLSITQDRTGFSFPAAKHLDQTFKWISVYFLLASLPELTKAAAPSGEETWRLSTLMSGIVTPKLSSHLLTGVTGSKRLAG